MRQPHQWYPNKYPKKIKNIIRHEFPFYPNEFHYPMDPYGKINSLTLKSQEESQVRSGFIHFSPTHGKVYDGLCWG